MWKERSSKKVEPDAESTSSKKPLHLQEPKAWEFPLVGSNLLARASRIATAIPGFHARTSNTSKEKKKYSRQQDTSRPEYSSDGKVRGDQKQSRIRQPSKDRRESKVEKQKHANSMQPSRDRRESREERQKPSKSIQPSIDRSAPRKEKQKQFNKSMHPSRDRQESEEERR